MKKLLPPKSRIAYGSISQAVKQLDVNKFAHIKGNYSSIQSNAWTYAKKIGIKISVKRDKENPEYVYVWRME
jgi:hypothetical protein